MNQREKSGLIGLGVLVGGWFLYQGIDSVFLEPIREQQLLLTAAETRLSKAEEEEIDLMVATKQLASWRSRSLPTDVLAAQSEYMEWLTELARLSGFRSDDSLVVKPGATPNRTGAFAPVQVEIEAQATLEAVSRFLYYFHGTDLAHRIVSLELKSPEAAGNPELGVTLSAEGLSITGAERRSILFPSTVCPSGIAADQDTLEIPDGSDFPIKQVPFRVRIGREFVRVTEVDESNWTVERGADGTRAAEHPEGTRVELAPTRTIAARISKAIKPTDSKLLIDNSYGFPYQPGFLVQVGEETMLVTGVSGRDWVVERGYAGTSAVGHKSNAAVRLAMPMETYEEQLLALSPFVKPAPPREYSPELIAEDQEIQRGGDVELTAKVEDFNPDLGTIRFELSDGPDGLTLDEDSGQITWAPGEEVEPGKFEFTLRALQGSTAETIAERTVAVTIVDPNQAPEITVPDGREIYQGQPLRLQVSATDPESQTIRFQLEEGTPAGVELDSETGELTWQPSRLLAPGEYSIKVRAEDSGSPSESDSGTIPITLLEDTASFVFLVACISQDADKEAWLYDRAENKTVIVRRGDAIEFASVRGIVDQITEADVTLKMGSELRRLPLGQNLQSTELIQTLPGGANAETGAESDPSSEADSTDPAEDKANPPATGSDSASDAGASDSSQQESDTNGESQEEVGGPNSSATGAQPEDAPQESPPPTNQ